MGRDRASRATTADSRLRRSKGVRSKGAGSAAATVDSHVTMPSKVSSRPAFSLAVDVEELVLAQRHPGLDVPGALPVGPRAWRRAVDRAGRTGRGSESAIGPWWSVMSSADEIGRRLGVVAKSGRLHRAVAGVAATDAQGMQGALLAEEGAARPARVPQHQGIERGARRLDGGQGGTHPHPDRRHHGRPRRCASGRRRPAWTRTTPPPGPGRAALRPSRRFRRSRSARRRSRARSRRSARDR